MKHFLLISLFISSTSLFSQNVVKGKLSITDKKSLLAELESLNAVEIDSLKTVVINFYLIPERKPNGSCIDHYTSDRSYIKSLRKKSNVVQFFITEKNYAYGKPNVKEDKNNSIKELLFKDAAPCGNYIIIKPNGDFLKRIGEYRQDEIPGLIESF